MNISGIGQTMGPLCPICGGPSLDMTFHGWGVCRAPERTVERYIGLTPDQVRQIVREELARALPAPTGGSDGS